MDNNYIVPGANVPNGAQVSIGHQVANMDLGYTGMIKRCTIECLNAMTPAELKNPEFVECEVTTQVRNAIEMVNHIKFTTKGASKWQVPKQLSPNQIADILLYSQPIKRIIVDDVNDDPRNDMVGIFCESGSKAGTYDVTGIEIANLCTKYNTELTEKQIEEIMAKLSRSAERVPVCENVDLVAVNNGVFDYASKTLLPFSPELVFLSKSSVNYRQNPVNPVIHDDSDNTDWDVESWMHTLSKDPEIVDALWQILGAIVRPLVSWDISAWLYADDGRNGKGTYCELARNLCGKGTYASVPLSEFGKEFGLEPLIGKSAIITDENSVGMFLDDCQNLKAVITQDPLPINRKNQKIISYRARLFMLQCFNEIPRVRDTSDSFFRRQLMIHFTENFTGREKPYIKHDYLKRKEVLEYVLWRVLNMNYYKIAIPAACMDSMEEFRYTTDYIWQFAADVVDELALGFYTNEFLYDLYIAWMRKSAPSASPKQKKAFIKEFKAYMNGHYANVWAWTEENPVAVAGRMDGAEKLIIEYNMRDWMDWQYMGTGRLNPTKKKTVARGMYRIGQAPAAKDDVI